MANHEIGDRVFICPWCEKPTTAGVRGVAIWDGYSESGVQGSPAEEYVLVQCQRCGRPAVQLREDFGRGFEDDEPAIVFPAPQRLSPGVPHDLRREWAEARTCFDAKAYTACVVMVRRTLEGTCKQQGVTERNLQRGLRALYDQGLIDGTLAEWADALRIVGNQGAHYTGRTVSRGDAEDALHFAEALLDHVYVLRQRFQAFQRRLEKHPTA